MGGKVTETWAGGNNPYRVEGDTVHSTAEAGIVLEKPQGFRDLLKKIVGFFKSETSESKPAPAEQAITPENTGLNLEQLQQRFPKLNQAELYRYLMLDQNLRTKKHTKIGLNHPFFSERRAFEIMHDEYLAKGRTRADFATEKPGIVENCIGPLWDKLLDESKVESQQAQG